MKCLVDSGLTTEPSLWWGRNCGLGHVPEVWPCPHQCASIIRDRELSRALLPKPPGEGCCSGSLSPWGPGNLSLSGPFPVWPGCRARLRHPVPAPCPPQGPQPGADPPLGARQGGEASERFWQRAPTPTYSRASVPPDMATQPRTGWGAHVVFSRCRYTECYSCPCSPWLSCLLLHWQGGRCWSFASKQIQFHF